MAEFGIKVKGLTGFSRALGALAPDYKRALPRALKAAAQPIAQDARRRYSARYQRRSGRGEGSIRVLASTRVTLAAGSARAPYIPAQEFGSTQIKRFAPRAPGGKFLYPALAAGRDDLIDEVDRALEHVARRAFPGSR